MHSDRTIYYACPDSPAPSGGVRRLYRHVEILNNHGFSAFVLHSSPSFKITWFDSNAPVRFREASFVFSKSDILVIPEVMTPLMKQSMQAGILRMVIALNWAFIFGSLPIGEDWRTYGISQAIAGSQCEHDFILATMGIDASVLVAGNDCDLFAPATQKQLQIAFMPRRQAMVREILGAFRAIYKEHSDTGFVSMDGLSHAEVAKILGRSAIFLAATFPEGIGRPRLEAMAAACIVVGFTGRGAAEYMNHLENCYVAEDGDILGAAKHLNDAVCAFRSGAAKKMQLAARSTALRYNLANEEMSVLKYWTERLSSM